MNQQQLSFQAEIPIVKKVDLDYLLYLPNGYKESVGPFPLVIFLHGAGERGEDLSLVQKHGPTKKVEEGEDFPFILIAPQCPELSDWGKEKEGVLALIDQTIDSHNIDVNRVYLTGLSMGGYGTWDLAMERPNQFAAIAPVCGGGLSVNTKLITHIPTWVFHGAKDDIVPVEESRKMVAAYKANGGSDIRYTEYPEADHDSWTETYDNPEFYEWFLSHRRGS